MRRYNDQRISRFDLATGCRLAPADRAGFLARLAAHGRVTNARDVPPKPTPTPEPEPTTVLYPFLLKVFPAWSYGLQGRGDCMAWSAMHNIDILMAVQIDLHKKSEIAHALACIEAAYGFMRVEVYGGQPDYSGDGGSPSAAAESVMKCGTLHRLKYDKHDLRIYDETGGRSGEYGRYGVPDVLEPTALKHVVGDVALVTDFDTAVKMLAQGRPSSNADTRNPIWTHRDNEGFGVSRWHASHAMNYIGYRLGDRPGLLKTNTGHGNHVSGPRWPKDLPDSIANCSAWEDADVAEKVLKEEWSWVYSDYKGFPTRDLLASSITPELLHPAL